MIIHVPMMTVYPKVEIYISKPLHLGFLTRKNINKQKALDI